MFLSPERYVEAVAARRALTLSHCAAAAARGMKTLNDCGWDGDYVVPNQLSSCAFDGPVLLLNNWYGWFPLEQLDSETEVALRRRGYLDGIPTNRWLDRALSILGLRREDVYITQACLFLPRHATGAAIPDEVYALCVRKVLRLELAGRTPVALGAAAQRACRRADIPFVAAQHPSYQGGERRAQEIAAAIRQVTP